MGMAMKLLSDNSNQWGIIILFQFCAENKSFNFGKCAYGWNDMVHI